MKVFATVLLFSATAMAQMELPPGTTSPVPAQQAQPDASTAALAKAEDAIANGAYPDAIALLTALATPANKNARVFYDLAFAHDALNHDADAAKAYAQAVTLQPNDAATRVSYGLLLARTGKLPAAEEQLTAATAIQGADRTLLGRAYRALAEVHLKSAPEKARTELVAALRDTPETPADAATAAEIAAALQDDTATEQAYAHAFQVDPSNIDVATGYARVLGRTKQFAKQDAVLTQALQQHPANHALLAEQASARLLQGHPEAALPSLTALHTDEPDNTAVTLLLARAYSASGAPDKAQTIYGALLAASPDDVTLMTEAADNLIRLRKSVEAEPLLLKAVATPDRFPSRQSLADAAGELAFAASSNKDAPTVLKALELRSTISPATAPFTFLSATAHDTLHHTKQAAEAYRLFLTQAAGKFPDQEWQAQQRLQVLDRGK